jgi:hypothetical protein
VSAIDARLRARLIDAGLLRPQTNELPNIQLPPGTYVYRLAPSGADRARGGQ